MTAGLGVVSTELELRLVVPGSTSLPVRSALTYDPADPYAVTASFHAGSGSSEEVVQWTFARDLLSDGVTAPVGTGDVRVWPATSGGSPVVWLSLSSPSGKALFEMPLAELVEFLRQTYDVVPIGKESNYVDVDAELAVLLRAEPEP